MSNSNNVNKKEKKTEKEREAQWGERGRKPEISYLDALPKKGVQLRKLAAVARNLLCI